MDPWGSNPTGLTPIGEPVCDVTTEISPTHSTYDSSTTHLDESSPSTWRRFLLLEVSAGLFWSYGVKKATSSLASPSMSPSCDTDPPEATRQHGPLHKFEIKENFADFQKNFVDHFLFFRSKQIDFLSSPKPL